MQELLENPVYPSRDPELFLDEFGNLENLKCSVCLMVPHFEDAIEHKDCAHVFCSECLSSLKNPECPLCGFPMSSNRKIVQENIFIYRIMKTLRTRCDRKECDKVVDWSSLPKHLFTDCEFGHIVCKFGCGDKVLRKYESVHLEHCLKRKVICQYCHESILFSEQDKHIHEECMDSPFMLFPCKYSKFGCKAQYQHSEEEEHMQKEQWRHMNMMLEGFSLKIDQLEKENQQLKNRLEILEKKPKKKSIDLLGTMENSIHEEVKNQNENLLEKDFVCVVCGEKAMYLCCNRENAKNVYKQACNYMCCEKHTSHNSDDCRRQGRQCEGVNHNCDINPKFCGLISLFGTQQK